MNLRLRKFRPGVDTTKPFDCSDADLNGFLVETSTGTPNATFFAKELLAVTYVLEDTDTGKIAAYFSLLNDKVDRDFADPKIWNNLSRKIPNAKRRYSYPALKIGRLAVSDDMKGQDIGTKIINYIQNPLYIESFYRLPLHYRRCLSFRSGILSEVRLQVPRPARAGRRDSPDVL